MSNDHLASPADMLPELPLAGLRVGISGAVPEREHWGNVVDLDRLIQSFVAQLSGFVMDYGGQIVHGSHPSLTRVIAEEARNRAERRKEPLVLIASEYFGSPPAVTLSAAKWADAPILLTGAVTDNPLRNPRDESLTAMRAALVEHIDVLVAVGGMLHQKTGFQPGIVEELAQARWHNVACFIVAGFGGAAGALEGAVLEEFTRGNLLEGAADMYQWTDDMDVYVGTLLAHFVRYRDVFVRREVRQRSMDREREEVISETTIRRVDVNRQQLGLASARIERLNAGLKNNQIEIVREVLRSAA